MTQRFLQRSASALAVLLAYTPAYAIDTKTIINSDLYYIISVPTLCRVEEGPGTLEAVCSPDLNPEASQAVVAASALLLEIDSERVPNDLKAAYGEADFRQELPEAVCGESDPTRAQISNINSAIDGPRTIWTAAVVCSEIKFLGLPERSASVRYVMTPAARYRMMTRTPTSFFASTQAVRDAFLSSFKITADKSQ
jgi:hypothetical protein